MKEHEGRHAGPQEGLRAPQNGKELGANNRVGESVRRSVASARECGETDEGPRDPPSPNYVPRTPAKALQRTAQPRSLGSRASGRRETWYLLRLLPK